MSPVPATDPPAPTVRGWRRRALAALVAGAALSQLALPEDVDARRRKRKRRRSLTLRSRVEVRRFITGLPGRKAFAPLSMVSGRERTVIREVILTLDGMTWPDLGSLDIYLVRDGVHYLAMSDAGNGAAPNGPIRFDSRSRRQLPETPAGATLGGTFRPGNFDGQDTDGGVERQIGFGTLRGTVAEGLWELVMFVDTDAGDGGSLGSWSLTLLVDVPR